VTEESQDRQEKQVYQETKGRQAQLDNQALQERLGQPDLPGSKEQLVQLGPLVRRGPWGYRVPQEPMGSLALWVQLALLDNRDHVETLVPLDQLETKEALVQLEIQVSLGQQDP
jgi:hypothetical protein